MDYTHSISYEYKINDSKEQLKALKETAFSVMDSMHGWCSHQKAGVLIELVTMLKPMTIVEIGVFGGKSLIPMAMALKSNGIGIIHGIDPWNKNESIVGLETPHKEWWGQIDHDLILNDLLKIIVQNDLSNHVKISRQNSATAVPIPEIDFLHIDGNRSEQTSVLDVLKWVPLVKKKGLIIIEDFNCRSRDKAVTWLNKHCVKLIEFKEENVWAIWVKV